MTAPAGWYPQPDGAERFWSGTAWTHHVRPPAGARPTGIQDAQPGAATGPYTAFPPVQGGPPGYAGGHGAPAPYPSPHPAAYGFYPPAVAAKNPGVALLASFFIPGLGQLVNGEGAKGVLIFLGYVVSWVLVLVIVGIFGVVGFWVWGMVDAYLSAQRWNYGHGVVS